MEIIQFVCQVLRVDEHTFTSAKKKRKKKEPRQVVVRGVNNGMSTAFVELLRKSFSDLLPEVRLPIRV